MSLDYRQARSFLFAPGNHERRAAKVFQSGAEVAILDLEDAVAVDEKIAARDAVVRALQAPRACLGFVRVNAPETVWCWGDLHAVVGPGLDGLMVPKAEDAAALQALDWVLTQLERERGLAAGGLCLLPIIETARGERALEAIAGASPRVRRLAFGGADYSLDLGLQWTAGEQEFDYLRARLVHVSRAAGLAPPVDTVTVQVKEPERFRASSARARQFGLHGKLLIHPDQVPLCHEAFAPTAAEVARARRIIEAFAAAEAEGIASLRVDGEFIDYPVVEKARRVLAAAAVGPGV
ncbi:MAG: HpcH/HpaI aldolase/citrate lyase family protein [Gammaproteobacteria bacterium]